MSNAPTTARAVPLFVPTSASWPESPPTMKITPMMRLLMQSSEGTGTIEAGFGEVRGRPSLPDIITYRSTTSRTGVHVSTSGGGKNHPPINIHFSTCDVDSGQTAHLCSNLTICDVEKCIDLHH